MPVLTWHRISYGISSRTARFSVPDRISYSTHEVHVATLRTDGSRTARFLASYSTHEVHVATLSTDRDHDQAVKYLSTSSILSTIRYFVHIVLVLLGITRSTCT
jgi:hypothetical protein